MKNWSEKTHDSYKYVYNAGVSVNGIFTIRNCGPKQHVDTSRELFYKDMLTIGDIGFPMHWLNDACFIETCLQ